MQHPVDYAPSQDFGDNPTSILPADHWIIKLFGNYQPDGHSGIDYPCPAGTPVRAVAAGVVLHVGWMGGTYASNPWWIVPGFAGFVYVIDHGHFIGIYGHCLDGGARVSVGQHVAEGQIIGLSGNTGASTGDHLHFEALPKGFVLNSRMYGRINPASLFGGIQVQGAVAPKEKGFLMALSDQDQDNIYKAVGRIDQWITNGGPAAAVEEALNDPAVLDRIALAVLKRPCHLVGEGGQIIGTTTLAKKINWMAHNDAAILGAIVDVSKQLEVAHPQLPAEATIAEDVA